MTRAKTSPTRAEPRWGRAGGLALLALLLAACRGGPEAGPTPSPDSVVAAELLPSFEALARAVAAGEDEDARRILQRLRARGLSGKARELADTFGTILRGRELVARLELELRDPGGEPAAPSEEGAPPPFRAELHASQPGPGALTFTAAAPRLRLLLTAVDEGGREERRVQTVAIEGLGALRLEPGEELTHELPPAALPRGGYLAVRAEWSLEWPAGEIRGVGDDRGHPAMDVRARSTEQVRLAPYLPPQPVEPEELARYVARAGFWLPAALERAVRVPAQERGRALDLLAPLVEEMNRVDLTRLVPVLRWLAGTDLPGGDPFAWRRWVRARERGQPGSDQPRPRLDLPGDSAPGIE